MSGRRFLKNDNVDSMEVHDLYDERKGCQINEILSQNISYLDEVYSKTDLRIWFETHPEFDGCKWCLEEFHRK